MRKMDLTSAPCTQRNRNSHTTNSSTKKCSTTEKRNAYPYRRIYFEKNPGLFFGHLWFCSQCHRPIWSKHNVVVDHIVPLNKGGINHHLNCVAICNSCNLHKSDKVDYRVAVGFASKGVESTVLLAKQIAKTVVVLGFTIVGKGIGLVFKGAKSLVSQGITGVVLLLAIILAIAYCISTFV